MKTQFPPTMAPEHPLVTVAVALVVLSGMFFLATQPSGLASEDNAQGPAEESTPEEPESLPAEGEPDGQTVVSADVVEGLEEEELTHDGGLTIQVNYPRLPHAEPLADFLDHTLTTEIDAFDAANPGASAYETEWQLTAAHDGLLGVRLLSTETDSEGAREGYATYWYDTETGTVHGSSSLLGGQERLEELNTLVREQVGDAVDASTIHPIASLYDSVGFNPDGDLVVEFDAGQVAPAGEGRVHAVIDRDRAEPLLSDLGVRVREAATVGVERFEVAGPPEAEKDGVDEEAPGALSPIDDEVDCSDPETKCVALTYDDGPGGGTPALLDSLAEYDARATFFVTGHPVMENPTTLRRAYAEGHEIANHTLSHPDLSTLSAGGARENLEVVQALVHREVGYTMDLMRPPYGATDSGVTSVTEELGLAQILWSVDTNDWRDRDASVVTDRALRGTEDGAIILMHDIHDTTISASHEIIRELDSRGYTMVTVTQLLGTTEPGEEYVDGSSSETNEGTGDIEVASDDGEE